MKSYEHRPSTLTLPAGAQVPSGQAVLERWQRRCHGLEKCRLIGGLSRIVNIAPELPLDQPLPAIFAPYKPDGPDYYLDPGTSQPIVRNGFVWSYRADGSGHRVQHFLGGVDIFGGPALEISNGIVYMHTAGGVTECRYFAGHCCSVTSRPTKSRDLISGS